MKLNRKCDGRFKLNKLAAAVLCATTLTNVTTVTAEEAIEEVFDAAVADPTGEIINEPTGGVAGGEAVGGTIEEVVVTATRRSESVQDVPYNISAFSGDALSVNGVDDASDLVRVIPGLSAIDTGQRNRNVLAIRGLNASGLDANDEAGAVSTVGTYIDDTPINIDLRVLDLNRVEVLRGPQGTLFGAGSLGGTLRYILNKPQFDDTYSASLDAGVSHTEESDGVNYHADLIVNVPVNDKLALRGYLGRVEKDGFIDYDNVGGLFSGITGTKVEDVNNEEINSARFAMTWLPTDTMEVNLNYLFQEQKTGGRQVVNKPFTGDDYSNSLQHTEPNALENHLFTGNITWDTPSVEFTSTTSWHLYDEEGRRDQAGLLINLDYGYEGFPAFRAFTADGANSGTFTQEFRAVSTADGPWKWIAGAFYTKIADERTSFETTPGMATFFGQTNVNDFEYVSQTSEDIDELAVYGEVSYQFTDAWQITAGARYFMLDQETASCTDFPLYENMPGTPAFEAGDCNSGQESITDYITKFNTSYYFTDDIMGYFTRSEGFRRGGSNALPNSGQQGADVLPSERTYKPDETINYEIGMRTSWDDVGIADQVIFNAAAFYIDWKDIQLKGLTQAAALPIILNSGDAESMGVEVETKAAFSEALTGVLGYSFTEAQLTSTPKHPSIIGGAGDRLPAVPRHQLSAGIDYFQPTSFGDMVFHLDASYSSDITSQLSKSHPLYTELGGYTITNGSIRLEKDNWTVKLFADNLLNEYAEVGLRNYELAGNGANVGEFRYVVRPRTVGVGITYDFN